jgi:hypothetical protein
MAKFQKGNRFGRGRPKGALNRSNLLGKEMLLAFGSGKRESAVCEAQ